MPSGNLNSPLRQQTKEKVKLLIQLADSFVEKGHIHATEIRKWVTTVDKHYRDFSLRMGKYQYSLEKALGVNTEVGVSCPGGMPPLPSPSAPLLPLLWKEAGFQSHLSEPQTPSALAWCSLLMEGWILLSH